MAILHVKSGSSNTSPYETWAKAATSFATAVSAAGADDTIYVDSAFSEAPTATTTYDFAAATATGPIRVISVASAGADGSDDTYTRGGSIALDTGGFYTLNIETSVANSVLIFEGMDFAAWKVVLGSAHWRSHLIFRDCKFTLNKDNTSSYLGDGANTEHSRIELENCEMVQSAQAGTRPIKIMGADWRITNLTITVPATQTDAFIEAGSKYGNSQSIVQDTDLTGYSTLVNDLTDDYLNVVFRRCELKAGYTVNSDTLSGSSAIYLEDCASGDITATVPGLKHYEDAMGIVAVDTARYRTGGANNGETDYCWAMQPNTVVDDGYLCLRTPPMVVWHDASGSKTLTIYVASGVTLQNDEVWIEVSGGNETAAPNPTTQGKYQTTRYTANATPANLTTDSGSTWNGTGVGTKQKLSVTVNQTEPGPVTVAVCIARDVDIYVDPKPELT